MLVWLRFPLVDSERNIAAAGREQEVDLRYILLTAIKLDVTAGTGTACQKAALPWLRNKKAWCTQRRNISTKRKGIKTVILRAKLKWRETTPGSSDLTQGAHHRSPVEINRHAFSGESEGRGVDQRRVCLKCITFAVESSP